MVTPCSSHESSLRRRPRYGSDVTIVSIVRSSVRL